MSMSDAFVRNATMVDDSTHALRLSTASGLATCCHVYVQSSFRSGFSLSVKYGDEFALLHSTVITPPHPL